MATNWDALFDRFDDAGKEMLSILKPYLPALAREGPDLFEGFIKHFKDQDWAKIDALMYEKMTLEERRELEEQVYQDARDAAEAKYRRSEILKNIAFKVALRAILLVLAG